MSQLDSLEVASSVLGPFPGISTKYPKAVQFFVLLGKLLVKMEKLYQRNYRLNFDQSNVKMS